VDVKDILQVTDCVLLDADRWKGMECFRFYRSSNKRTTDRTIWAYLCLTKGAMGANKRRLGDAKLEASKRSGSFQRRTHGQNRMDGNR
jgi:hypothetical protein